MSIGFINGLKQWNTKLDFMLPSIPALDFAELDKLLGTIFQIEIEEFKGLDFNSLDEIEKNIAQYVWRVAHIGRSLLQAIKIPCFDGGYIDTLKFNSVEKNFTVSIYVPIVEHFHINLILRAYRTAFRLLSKLREKNIDKSEFEAIFEKLEQEFIDKLGKEVSGGKSTVPLLGTAFRKNIPFMHLGAGIYQLGWGSKMKIFDRSSIHPDSAIGAKISHNKHLTSQILRSAGLPTPRNILVNSIHHAIEASKIIGFPVVIKPSDSDRGEGVTIAVNSIEMVTEAFNKAAKLSKNILVEKTIPGVCHRILIMGDCSPYTVKRLPKSVKGDGTHTIKELIQIANDTENLKAKYKRVDPFLFDSLAEETLRPLGFNQDSVPNDGQFIPLRSIESTEWGGTAEIVTESIHPENIKIALLAAKLLNLENAGIDFISEDSSVPWYANEAAINEINYAPLMTGRLDYQRKGLEILLEQAFPLNSRIPVEVFIGNDAGLKKALKRQNTLIKKNINCFLSTHNSTYSPNGEMKLAFTSDGLFQRCQALLMNNSVGHIILVIQTDEFLQTGLPVDLISSINIVNKDLVSIKNPHNSAESVSFNQIISMINQYLAKQDISETV